MPDLSIEPTAAFASLMDQQDALARFRDQFAIAPDGLLYMDGNSLGRLPKAAPGVVREVVEAQWGERLIRAWGEGWYTAPRRVGDKIAGLVGAAPGQVIVSDSTSVNLYKLIMAALTLPGGRPGGKIVSDTLNFPSDLYILQGCVQALGGQHRLQVVEGGFDTIHERLLQAIDRETVLVVLSHVAFKSGALYDARAITAHAHQMGARVLWDLSHSAGAAPVELDAWGVDFAVGCTYKYLNGGPGAPAFLYVRQELQERAVSPIWGWFGEARPFAFDLDYQPAPGIERFLCGTPPLIALLAAETGIDLLAEAGIPALRAKSLRQTGYLIALFDRFLAPLGFTLGTPRAPEQRGSHVSIRHPEGYRINRTLIEEMQVIPDFREPDNIRLGIAPIYTRFADIWETVQRIAQVVEEGRYGRYPAERPPVT